MYDYDRTAADSLAAKAKKLKASIKVLEAARDALHDPETVDPKMLPKPFHSNVRMYSKDIEKAAMKAVGSLAEVIRHQRNLLEYIEANS